MQLPVNGHNYIMGYYSADGIYTQWAALVKTIFEPHGNKQSHFATMQEAAKKDVGIRNFVAADDMLCYSAQFDCRE